MTSNDNVARAGFFNVDPLSRDKLPAILIEDIAPPLNERETEIWKALPPEKKSLVVNRLEALAGWNDGQGNWPIERATSLADLSSSRFYSLSAQWSDAENRSFANLGIHADGPRKRRSRYSIELFDRMRAEAGRVIEKAPKKGFSLEKVITHALAAVADIDEDKPSRATVRLIVEDVIRETGRGDTAGSDIAFDCCAVDIPGQDKKPFILFAGVDKSTGLILGMAVGQFPLSVEGYRGTASDIIHRISNPDSVTVPWAPSVKQTELIIGSDLELFRDWESEVKKRVRLVNFQGFNTHKRFGRYMIAHIGRSIGRIALLPGITIGGRPLSRVEQEHLHDVDEARMRLEVEMVVHNRTIAQAWSDSTKHSHGGNALPEHLERLLNAMSV